MTRFAKGGVVPVRFSSTDEVPAMLSSGCPPTPARFVAPGVSARLAASLDEQAETMTTGDGEGWTCPRCERGQCARCRDESCACCNGNPDG